MEAASSSNDEVGVPGYSGVTESQVAELKMAGRELVNAVKALDARITDLTERIESLGGGVTGAASTRTPPVQAEKVASGKVSSEALSNFVVRIEPLRELAMAAMAETALRDLPSVEQVLSVERAENWANFTLEVKTGADLVEEMKGVMPVYFKVTDSSPDRLSIALAWAWGEPGASD